MYRRCLHSLIKRSWPPVLRPPGRQLSSLSSDRGIPLHYDWVHPPETQELDHVVLFLHGLLGNGRNVRTMAKKLCDASQRPGVLLDVRGHGNSKVVQSATTSSTFASCVQDVHQTLEAMVPQVHPETEITLVGHSLGGRISLQYAHNHVTTKSNNNNNSNNPLQRIWLLDTVPGEANDAVERVVGAVTDISSKAPITDKKQLVQQLTTDYKIDKGTAQWLASSLQKKTKTDELQFSFDLTVVNDLLTNFHEQDFMQLLQEILETNTVTVDLVRGGKNKGWTEANLAPLRQLQQEYPSNFGMHELPKAGHWVHVDDLPGLLDVMEV
ncbi:Abhydrolase domain containing [Seminavis robusta]|uniref:Abhydrolase domain containing n=1 Tax=Seminavis robusta TaxID=568900 RepID=A0A9N8DBQ0_9STRA|nr:Abhydrolase domain containing [Seminavis robusta]|eukprot:Sro25_g017340.1 Abhydrolase domain containing (325) ;mRNA; f:162738-163712